MYLRSMNKSIQKMKDQIITKVYGENFATGVVQ